MAPIYNYEKATELIQNRFKSNTKTVTYDELQEVLGLKAPLGTKDNRNSNAMGLLRTYLKDNVGLSITSAMRGRLSEGEDVSNYRYFTIHSLNEDGNYELLSKENELEKYKNKCHALEKDNQKLYLEIEKLKEEISELEEVNEEYVEYCLNAKDKEEEYFNIIGSYNRLLELNR